MSYVLSKTLLLYPVLVSLGLAIFAIVMLLLPARTPYVYQLLKQSSSRLQAISEDYRDSHFPLYAAIAGDYHYQIDRKENCLVISRLVNGTKKQNSRMAFGTKKLISIALTQGTESLPAVVLGEEKDGIRTEYVFFPQTNKLYPLLSYKHTMATYNLDNNGILNSQSPFVLIGNSLYFAVQRMDLDEKTPRRGIWKLDLQSGKSKQLYRTAAFILILSYGQKDDKELLMFYAAAVRNGAKHADTSDSNAYLGVMDTMQERFLWVKEFSHQNMMFPLWLAGKGSSLFNDSLILVSAPSDFTGKTEHYRVQACQSAL